MLRTCLAISFVLFIATISVAQDKYAIVVGVEAYDTGTFDSLDFANEDANAMGKSLASLGFKTQVMTSDAASATLRPSSPNKIATIIKTVAGSCGPGDTLLVSLSGHGVQFADEQIRPDGTRETYFCPQDATLSNKASMLKISSLMNFMSTSKATQKLLLVDSCRESVLSPTGKRKSAKRIELGSVHESRKSVSGGLSVLFSCSSQQFSWEHEDLQHSVFSNYVIEYLNGSAGDRFYDRGEMDLDGLVFFVRKRTNEFVFSKNLSPDGQMPILRGSSSNWKLGKLPSLTLAKTITNSVGAKLNLIPAGEFLMGSPASEKDRAKDETQHRVRISKAFYMGQTEVTQGQWKSVMGTEPWKGKDLIKEGSAYPATYVSWDDAVEFCKRLSKKEDRVYRLPTEAEWEYACRGETRTAYSFGDTSRNISQYGWWGGRDGNAKTEEYAHRVGQLKPNAHGLYDMHGNVCEWCSDWYDAEYYGRSPLRDPSGPDSGSSRVLRGGGWNYLSTGCRSAYRSSDVPSNRFSFNGFRVVLSFD